MSARKLERLVNLLLLLLSARRPLTADEIRAMLPAYDQADPDAFRRMFERDKDELRDLGVPLETGWVDAWEVEQGYRVRRADYELPPVQLEPDEAAAVALAARLWQSAGLAEASASALLKLRAAGIEADPVYAAAVEPRVETADPAFEPCLAAVRARRPVSFGYRSAGGGVATRTVEPWGVVHRKGRWYLVGHDRDRAATRAFRLSRIEGGVKGAGRAGEYEIPPGVDLVAAVAGFGGGRADGTARIRVAPGSCWDLRRIATRVEDGGGGGGGGVGATGGGHREGPTAGGGAAGAAGGGEPDVPDVPDLLAELDELTVPYGDVEQLADLVVGFGPDAVVLDPPELRDAVVARLRVVAGAA